MVVPKVLFTNWAVCGRDGHSLGCGPRLARQPGLEVSLRPHLFWDGTAFLNLTVSFLKVEWMGHSKSISSKSV